jgi:hypothetical protein
LNFHDPHFTPLLLAQINVITFPNSLRIHSAFAVFPNEQMSRDDATRPGLHFAMLPCCISTRRFPNLKAAKKPRSALKRVVAGAGIEPATQGFSVLLLTVHNFSRKFVSVQ